MLNELKNLECCGSKDWLLYLLDDVIGKNRIKIKDIKIICSHAHGKQPISVDNILAYCLTLGWIQELDDYISLSPQVLRTINNGEDLNLALVVSTLDQLFLEDVFDSNMFYYESIKRCYAFKNERFPLALSCVRNMLISQGFLISQINAQGKKFYVASEFEGLIAKKCSVKRKTISLESLKKQIENNEIAGEKAELFVLSFEQKRLESPLNEQVKRISEIDVSAGYDIVSFDSKESEEPDRFIEVKAVSCKGFYWSNNEYEVAKLKGDSYYLYLVELSQIKKTNYIPVIIKNPAVNIMKSEDWFVEPQSYFVKYSQ